MYFCRRRKGRGENDGWKGMGGEEREGGRGKIYSGGDKTTRKKKKEEELWNKYGRLIWGGEGG